MKKLVVVGTLLLFLGSSIPALGQASVKESHATDTYTFKVAFISGHYDGSKRGLLYFELMNMGFPGGNNALEVYGHEKHGWVHVYASDITGGLHFGSIGLKFCRCTLVAFNVNVVT